MKDAKNSNKVKCSKCYTIISNNLDCPICELQEKIDKHIESILMQILASYYSKYMFEIDDRVAAWIRESGFSFQINRKENLNYLLKQENINHKNTYLLMASHIESAFKDVQTAHKLFRGKNISGINSDSSLYKHFVNAAEENNFNKSIFKKIRYKKIIDLIRLVVNIIKHNNCIVKPNSKLGKLLRLKINTDIEEVWRKKILSIKQNILLGDTFKITCVIRSFLFDLAANLIVPSKIFHSRKINELETMGVLRYQLRRNISKVLIKVMHDEGLMLCYPHFIRNANDSKIFSFVKAKKEVLEKINKINPKYVIALETGIGYVPEDNKTIRSGVLSVNALVSGMHRNKSKSKFNKRKFSKIYLKIFDNLSLKYGKDAINSLACNDFQKIKKSLLSKIILDFYKEVCAAGKKDAGILMRGIGEGPFRSWNPFRFNENVIMH